MSDYPADSSSLAIPWPETGDRLFRSDYDSWHDACLRAQSDEWRSYASGYKLAGDALVEHVTGSRSYQDNLLYPTVFVYRQYLELILKKLIADCRVLLDQEPESRPTHDLTKLWETFAKSFFEVAHPSDQTGISAVDAIIREFATLDPHSEAFRYPVTKGGHQALPSELTHINVRHLADIMKKLEYFFSGSADVLEEYLGYKSEMEAESYD